MDVAKILQEISLLKSQIAMMQNDIEARRSDEVNAVVRTEGRPREVLASQEPAVIEPWNLHYSLDAADVTLSAGYVFWGLKTMAVAASGPNAVTDGDCWGIEVTYSGGAYGAAWAKKSSVTAFVDTEEIMRQFYYKFSVASGVASIAEIGAKGNWKIPSTFAPEV